MKNYPCCLDVTGSKSYVGGVIGILNNGANAELNTITSHAVSVNGANRVGGLMGQISANDSVVTVSSISISRGNQRGTFQVGGLIGLIRDITFLNGIQITINDTITELTDLSHDSKGHVIGRINGSNPTVNLTNINVSSAPEALKLVGIDGGSHTFHPNNDAATSFSDASITKP